MSFEDWDFLEAKRLLKEPAVPASWCESVIAKFDSNVATKPPPPRIPLEKIVWKR
jgi:hypothetical protein